MKLGVNIFFLETLEQFAYDEDEDDYADVEFNESLDDLSASFVLTNKKGRRHA